MEDVPSFVHHIVSTSNEFVTEFSRLLKSPQKSYELPREVIESLQSVLSSGAHLISNLYEQTEFTKDYIETNLKALNE